MIDGNTDYDGNSEEATVNGRDTEREIMNGGDIEGEAVCCADAGREMMNEQNTGMDAVNGRGISTGMEMENLGERNIVQTMNLETDVFHALQQSKILCSEAEGSVCIRNIMAVSQAVRVCPEHLHQNVPTSGIAESGEPLRQTGVGCIESQACARPRQDVDAAQVTLASADLPSPKQEPQDLAGRPQAVGSPCSQVPDRGTRSLSAKRICCSAKSNVLQKPYYCLECHKAFTSSDKLAVHATAHTGEEPYHCFQCSTNFRQKYEMKKHANTCPKTCSRENSAASTWNVSLRRKKAVVENKFSYEKSPKKHKHKLVSRLKTKRDPNQKLFKCSECELSFPQMSRLTKHIRTHTGEKPFLCSHCPASFTRSSDLTRHTRTHSGEKPYKCLSCPAAFPTSCKLSMHTRTHTGEKPYECSHCPASFARKTDLNMHVRTHTGLKPHTCTECATSFTTSSKLKIHFRIHTGEKPYQCTICLASFTQSAGLSKHMKTIHRAEKAGTDSREISQT